MPSSALAYLDYEQEPERPVRSISQPIPAAAPTVDYAWTDVTTDAPNTSFGILAGTWESDPSLTFATALSFSSVAFSLPAERHAVAYEPKRTPHSAAVEGAGNEPAWIEPTVLRLAELLGLPEGWDSYRAKAIQGRVVSAALHLLESAALPYIPAPIVVPTADGGIQFEWHDLGLDIELEVHPAEAPQLFFRDRRSGEEWDQQLEADLGPLSKVLATVAERVGR